ncbi:proline dehydrogenase, partial [Striga asiatica]
SDNNSHKIPFRASNPIQWSKILHWSRLGQTRPVSQSPKNEKTRTRRDGHTNAFAQQLKTIELTRQCGLSTLTINSEENYFLDNEKKYSSKYTSAAAIWNMYLHSVLKCYRADKWRQPL